MAKAPTRMTLDEVMAFLEAHGSEQTKKTFLRHGAREPFFGVKVADLKKLVKKIKKDHELSLALYDTGNCDAMYLAGLIADDERMTPKLLNDWVKKAYWPAQGEYTVPWVAADSGLGRDMGVKWIRSKQEGIASAGWAAYSSHVSITPDDDLDLDEIRGLLAEIAAGVHDAPNRVRYTMNGFVIAVGSCVEPLSKEAKATARAVGKVTVSMGDTSCKVPLATAYIAKVEDRGSVGKKRKGARC